MSERRSIGGCQRDLALRILPFIRPIPSPSAAFVPLQGSAMHFKATHQCTLFYITIYSDLIDFFAFGYNIFQDKNFACTFLTV